MPIPVLIEAIRQRHAEHAADQARGCDACRLVEQLDRAREALVRIQEMSSKAQWDPAAVAVEVRKGLGT